MSKHRPSATQLSVEDPEERALALISDIVGLLRLRGDGLRFLELSAPWGLRFPGNVGLSLHFIARGAAFLERADTKEIVKVASGDLIILPDACEHRLMDALGRTLVPIASVGKQTLLLPRIKFGGGGRKTHLIGGNFVFDQRLRVALPGFPPPLLHVRAVRGKPPEWLAMTMRLLAAEARNESPLRGVVLASIVDLIFAEAVRHWLGGVHEQGWLAAIRDPQVSSALLMMHERPERPWKIEALAREVGMSRSSFAQRFLELVGDPPSRYLTRWRVHHAARLLQASQLSVAEAGARVGYDSEAAFSRAFKRFMGVPPGTFRDNERTTPSAHPHARNAK